MGNQRRSMPNIDRSCKRSERRNYWQCIFWQKPGIPITANQLVLVKKFLCLLHLILNCGRDRHREKIIKTILFIITGIGSGIGARLKHVTTERMKLIAAAGFLDVDYPTKVTSAGGRYAFKDDWQTPDTQMASFEFGNNKSITWEGRSCNNYPVEGAGRGFIIYGDKGTLVNDGNDDYKIFDTDNKLVKEVKTDAKMIDKSCKCKW